MHIYTYMYKKAQSINSKVLRRWPKIFFESKILGRSGTRLHYKRYIPTYNIYYLPFTAKFMLVFACPNMCVCQCSRPIYKTRAATMNKKKLLTLKIKAHQTINETHASTISAAAFCR